jgi:DNA polymerase-3 subunit epsilon
VIVGKSRPLAFVDVETTGLSPAANRIAEIGVVTVDGDRIDRWTTLIKVSRRRATESTDCAEALDTVPAPSFGDIATELARRLSGRLLVAHNARFDHAFLRRSSTGRDRVRSGSPVLGHVVAQVVSARPAP